jgi:hypothetical protein
LTVSEIRAIPKVGVPTGAVLFAPSAAKARTDAVLTKPLTPRIFAALREVSERPTLNPLLNGEINPEWSAESVNRRLDWLTKLHDRQFEKVGTQYVLRNPS